MKIRWGATYAMLGLLGITTDPVKGIAADGTDAGKNHMIQEPQHSGSAEQNYGGQEAFGSAPGKYDYRNPVSVSGLDTKVLSVIREDLKKAILESDELDNKNFQKIIRGIRTKTWKILVGQLPKYGHANRPEGLNQVYFTSVWKEAINGIYRADIPVHNPRPRKDEEEAEFRTTLLNMLLRRRHAVELAHKVQTLIENGADKNLNKEFVTSSKMQNQTEFPLKIVLEEPFDGLEQKKVRLQLLKVLLDDEITYAGWKDPESDTREEICPVLDSLMAENNKNYVLENLFLERDFQAFDLVLGYLEKSNVFITEAFDDKISQIEGQISCPVFEKILGQMADLRSSATSTYNGNRVDNIDMFFNSSKFKDYISRSNPDIRYGEGFRHRLRVDYGQFFEKVAGHIDEQRRESELKGEQFQQKVLDWAELAHFALRVADHLNKFALSASNKAQTSNVIRLIRYTNIHHEGGLASKEAPVFKELQASGCKELIFLRRNKYNWTPLMYAMAKKQSEGIQLYLRQAPHEIDMVDGVDNNILHLAFPLPEEFYQDEHRDMDGNVLQMVGRHLGKQSLRAKTEEAIRAIITEKRIDHKHKVAALKRLSASNFTPVSLAAAMGFTGIYQYLMDFLKAEGEWNRDEHAHLDIHVEELAISGLANLLQNHGEKLTSEESEKIRQEIDFRKKDLDEFLRHSLDEVFSPESSRARKILSGLMDPVDRIFAEYQSVKDTRRQKPPYALALETAVRIMTDPASLMPQKAEQKSVEKNTSVWVMKKPAEYEKAGVISSSLQYCGLLAKPDPLWVSESFTGAAMESRSEVDSRSQEKTVPDDLYRMPNARTQVKISYLAPIVRKILAYYLDHHRHPRLLSPDVVLRVITGSQLGDFFRQNFNLIVEKRMRALIQESLAAAGRLDNEIEEQCQSENPFDFAPESANLQGSIGEINVFSEASEVISDDDVI